MNPKTLSLLYPFSKTLLSLKTRTQSQSVILVLGNGLQESLKEQFIIVIMQKKNVQSIIFEVRFCLLILVFYYFAP